MDSSAPTTDIAPRTPTTEASAPVEPIVEDLLVEDVSIDGMCGVY
ncbi:MULTISPECIES: mycofactocin precursor MftA [unclassified Pseudofrankia]|nr:MULTISPECIES: mycofactocin precursor MftA [unclassified Pseudofrankia]MDT3446256.1 mycofactocin precursor MftA [Pseudofrankia sp. BMG5.37]OHV49863.1 mycofactocin precursor [Pseudofrankia sp. BMG5.36]